MAAGETRDHGPQDPSESVAERIPGYRGYGAKELRRETDHCLRMHVAGRLEDACRRFEEIELAVSRWGDVEKLGAVDQVGRKLRTVRDRYLYADYPYAGLFNSPEVPPSVLVRLYEADERSCEGAEAIGGFVEGIVPESAAEDQSFQDDLDLLDDHVESLDEVFHDREHLVAAAGR